MSDQIIETVVVPPPPTRSGIAWGPVFGGAVVAVAVTVLLAAIGSGLGLASVSVEGGNPSATTFTVMAAVWLLVMQWVSSFFGGYLAGRLRAGWGGVHGDEVMFRDTAAGFVAWAAASLLIVAIVGSGAGSLLGGAGRAVTQVAASAAGGAATHATGSGGSDANAYLIDTIFRSPAAPAETAAGQPAGALPGGAQPVQAAPSPATRTSPAEMRAEAGRILAKAAVSDLSQADHDYLVQLVAERTGLSQADASKRVDAVLATEKQAVEKAKQAAETARKTAASVALFTGFSMLVGAFIACVAGAIGGRQRDAY